MWFSIDVYSYIFPSMTFIVNLLASNIGQFQFYESLLKKVDLEMDQTFIFSCMKVLRNSMNCGDILLFFSTLLFVSEIVFQVWATATFARDGICGDGGRNYTNQELECTLFGDLNRPCLGNYRNATVDQALSMQEASKSFYSTVLLDAALLSFVLNALASLLSFSVNVCARSYLSKNCYSLLSGQGRSGKVARTVNDDDIDDAEQTVELMPGIGGGYEQL